jgi:hypothetical protein
MEGADAGTARQCWEGAARLGTTGEADRGRCWEGTVGLGWRGWRGLEGASEGAGGSQRECAPLALPRGGGSQCWHGLGAVVPSAGGAGAA